MRRNIGPAAAGPVGPAATALYFTYSWGSPLWTDFNQILHIRRYAGLYHLSKFRYGKIDGFGKYGGQFRSKFAISHWNDWSPLQQCCATAQPVRTCGWQAACVRMYPLLWRFSDKPNVTYKNPNKKAQFLRVAIWCNETHAIVALI